MVACGAGFVATLLSGADKLDVNGMSVSVIVRLTLSFIFLILSLWAFKNARQLGIEEDKLKAWKDKNITDTMPK